MICIICGKPVHYVFTISNNRIFECSACTHRMTTPISASTHVSSIYSDDYFFGGKAGYPDYLSEKQLLIQRGFYYANILTSYIKIPGKLLDVGSAAGFILKGFADSGWDGYGIEPNDRMATYARTQLGLKVQTGNIESFKAKEQYDLICFIQVISHLIDPRKALSHCCNYLKPNGFILVETWNWKSWTARIFGRNWHEYCPPIVLHWFSQKSLNSLMTYCGFELIAKGRPKKSILSRHAKSFVSYKLKASPLAYALEALLNLIPDYLILPYPSEDLFWSLYKRK